LNLKFVLRGLILALPFAVIATVAGLLLWRFRATIGMPPDPTPRPPTIVADSGPPPAGQVVFEEWAHYSNGDYGMVGCGFLLQINSGEPVGVTTAHSLSFGNENRRLEQVDFRSTGGGGLVVAFDALRGPPGLPRSGEDMTIDYVLLQPGLLPVGARTLKPDVRGLPQPGERVSLYRCLPYDRALSGDPYVLTGTVQSSNDEAVWILMDDPFSFGLMSASGSPFISQHTGKVVGMLIAGTPRSHRLLLAAHPIASIVRLSQKAGETLPMAAFE
jgi:hypothetical protein